MSSITPSIGGLIAAHFTSLKDLVFFDNVVASCMEQSVPLAFFGVSLSSTDEVFDECAIAVERWRVMASDSSFFLVADRHVQFSQFEHYRLLYSKLSDMGRMTNTWLLFGDADDLWGPRRVESNLSQIGNPPPGKLAFASSYFVVGAGVNGSKTRDEMIGWMTHLATCPDANCAHFDQCPQSVQHYLQREDWEIKPSEGSGFEYFTICTHFSLFGAFFERVDVYDSERDVQTSSIVCSKFCDLAFGTFVFKSDSWWHDTLVRDALYLKIQHPSGQNNTYVPGGLGDAQLIHEEKVRAANFPDRVHLDNVRYNPWNPKEAIVKRCASCGTWLKELMQSGNAWVCSEECD